jgi:hypothetical protein
VTGNLLVITPSRGRPGQLADMLDATLGTSGEGTHVAVGYDDDDPERDGYESLAREARSRWPGRTFWHRGPGRDMTRWTNHLAVSWPRAFRYRYLASLGDDHFPQTQGWDETLTAAIESVGGTGIAYGNDLHQRDRLPTAPVISTAIVRALGWMILPGLVSKYADNVWKDLGDGAGCLSYVPDVIIEHRHPDAGKAPVDDTYARGNAYYDADRVLYRAWAGGLRDDDVKTVRDVMRLQGART